ncbi:hypothetical protein F3Y22_tig00110328pilonHSYRG01226 [Hibiscus syriacus]|uniref:DUF4283 domain-containing protein n=1 Tax=Hibiscus syriacus TaxID=106335 RepID=A0A6A3B436_HIBSY|nr:hypothetical protein F3Y22_tig00110328pilonHSYRG01226 [Hibiscus syriacus]
MDADNLSGRDMAEASGMNEVEEIESAKQKETGDKPETEIRGKATYASMIVNTFRARKMLNTGCGINDDEIVVFEEDYVIDKLCVFPTIRFSEKVHDQIDKNMRNVIIVRLLGRMIGYKALLNRIKALWKPIGEIQLIDLENNYFLVKFADEDDYTKVTEGSWTIYGSYLTVQPWS